MQKLTPRQIEMLTEKFDGIKRDWRALTRAQQHGRDRVLDGMRGYGRFALIERKTNETTLHGLLALEPHYADKPKIAAAIEARRTLEAGRAEAEQAAKQLAAEASERRVAARQVKLVEGYRRILADCHFDHASKPDDLILGMGNRIAEFENMA